MGINLGEVLLSTLLGCNVVQVSFGFEEPLQIKM